MFTRADAGRANRRPGRPLSQNDRRHLGCIQVLRAAPHPHGSTLGGVIDDGFDPPLRFSGLVVPAAASPLRAGQWVSVTTDLDQVTGSWRVTHVYLLEHETDLGFLDTCVRASSPEFWRPVLANFVRSVPVNVAIPVLLDKWPDLSTDERNAFLAALPDGTLRRHRRARDLLSHRAHIRLCLRMAADDMPAEQLDELFREIGDTLDAAPRPEREALWSEVPDEILDRHPALAARLPPALCVQRLIHRLRALADVEQQREVWQQALAVLPEKWPQLAASHQAELRPLLPSDLLQRDPRARALLPPDDHVATCLQLAAEHTSADQRRALLEELAAAIDAAPFARRDALWAQVSDDLLDNTAWLRARLPDTAEIQYLIRRLRRASPGPESDQAWANLRGRLATSRRWDVVPDDVAWAPSLWVDVPYGRRIALLQKHLRDPRGQEVPEAISRLTALLHGLPPTEFHSVLFGLARWVREDERLLPFLNHEDQAAAFWAHATSGDTRLWSQISWQARVFCVYRTAKETDDLGVLAGVTDDHPLVAATLLILRARIDGADPTELFLKAHGLIQDAVVAQAWNPADSLNLYPILPGCPPREVAYCEGRPWPTFENRGGDVVGNAVAFCPRTKGPCSFVNPHEIQTPGASRPAEGYVRSARARPAEERGRGARHGAWLQPQPERHWLDWSWHELLQACDVVPTLSERVKPDEYVNALAGWINRLIEIRDAMRCTICQKPMTPHYEYARHLARYRGTVFSCAEQPGHDDGVYLNHCWACRELIDSRKIRAEKVEDYYVCYCCGSGPQEPTEFSPGDVCPACGVRDMVPDERDPRVMWCVSCPHHIILPPAHRRTGPRWTSPGSGGADSAWASQAWPTTPSRRRDAPDLPDDDDHYERLAAQYADLIDGMDEQWTV